MEIDMDKFETNFTVQYECSKLNSLLMLLNMSRENYDYLKTLLFSFNKESITYLKNKYELYIEIYEEKIKAELNKTYRLN